ncbi:MAG: hypothetical protein N3B10_15675, partial [Armatimonadetes bacterium]|nr:hypothetical protein [Armatimonadota bacterium]MCX7969913.1 hypothetical protein [Armatimonadota bacterium]MDW8144619.1 hypothetical protein [Armatimonadota bacterium]
VVKNGVIVLDDGVRLPDGTVVEVRVISQLDRTTAIDRLLATRISKFIGFEEVLAEDRREREERVDKWFSNNQ